MAFDLNERLRESNARFLATMKGIMERYNHPFEDDFLVSMETLTYDTPDGPKQWGEEPVKSLKKSRKKKPKRSFRSREHAACQEISEGQSSGFEDDCSEVHEVSYVNAPVDTSDIGEESDADVVAVGRKFECIHFQNLNVDDVETPKKVKVKVDVIVQEDARDIPKWIEITPQESSKALYLASPVQELIDTSNQAIVCKKKVSFGNDCSSSRPLQLYLPCVSTSPNTVYQLFPEANETACDSILELHQSADEECPWSSAVIADLYPGMVESLMRLMKKRFQRKVFKYIARHYRRKKRRSRRARLNITVEKTKELKPLTLKPAQPDTWSITKEGIQNVHFGNNANASDNKCPFNLNGLVYYYDSDESEMEVDRSDSNLECNSTFVKGQNLPEQAVLPSVTARIGETFLVEDPLQAAASVKNSKCNESENWTYERSSDYPSETSTVSSGSAALHLVKESKTHKTNFPSSDTSRLCSSISNFSSNGNAFVPVRNSSLTASNMFLRNPEMKFPKREISLQRSHSFSFLPVNRRPSQAQQYEDAFEELYYKLCSKEIQKPLMLKKLPSSSRNLEEKAGLVKSNLSDPVRSDVDCDIAFEKMYRELTGDSVPNLPGLQRASNLRKYQEIQMSETVNALVNSPLRTSSAAPRVKRLASVQNDSLSSPVKRLKNTPERYFAPAVYHHQTHRKNVHLLKGDLAPSSTCSGSNFSFHDTCNCQSQDSGSCPSPNKTFLVSPRASPQAESGIADTHPDKPGTQQNRILRRSTRRCHQRVSRKLGYADEKA